jgi:hypothetical protein
MFSAIVDPCYQQYGNDCSRWALRIAAEVLLGLKIKGKPWRKFANLCSDSGDFIPQAISEFQKSFPKVADRLSFIQKYPKQRTARRSRRSKSKKEKSSVFLQVPQLLSFFDKNNVLILNVQNMKFQGDRIVYSSKKSRENHICVCIGHELGNLIILDSNKFGKSCIKYISLEYLDKSAIELEKNPPLGIVKKYLYVAEVFSVARAAFLTPIS